MAAQPGQECGLRGRFDQTRAERVGDRDVAGANRLDQARHAQHRVLAQFERIAEVVVLAAHDQVHRQQAAERLEVDAIVADRQVAAFDQRVAEVARQEGVLEVGLVVRAGRQQHDAGILAMRRHQAAQRLAVGLEEGREPTNLRGAKDVRQYARADDPVFERIAGARRRAGAIGDHPPLPVRRARQIRRINMQVDAARDRNAVTGPNESRMAENQLGRQQVTRAEAAAARRGRR